MITKESSLNKSCCFYASDFHLEMILLPYIKNKIESAKFVIITENNLEDTVKKLLDRINLSEKQKDEIINLNWKSFNNNKIDIINKYAKENEKVEIIVNGNIEFINSINKKIDNISKNNINVIDCFSVDDKKSDIKSIKNRYKSVLNTNFMYNDEKKSKNYC